LVAGCNLKQVAMRSLANTVSEPGDTYGRDDDPELVRDALPVMLKIMEQLGDGLPDHKGIHLALVRTFTSFGAAFVKEEAERVHETNVEKARPVFARSRKLFKRAWGYGTKGLDIAVPGLGEAFRGGSKEDRARLLALVKKEDVGLLYWNGAALGSMISVSKDDMKLVGEVPKVEQLMNRALELDESFDQGAIHEFFITYTPKKAKQHLDRALALSKNKKVGPLVAYAEAVTVDAQNKKEFTRLLEQVLAFDVDSAPENRLVNVLAQRRARWLMSRTSELFAE
jgi:predicted anti-sigma-YlaC factor YlaD